MAKKKSVPAPAAPAPEAPSVPAIKIVYWPIDKPQPYERNARIISENAVDVLCTSLKEFGFKQPIVVDKKGVIVMGHTRLRAAKKLGMTEVPVIVADDLSPEKIRQLRIMDNRSAQNTSWDPDVLKEELADMAKVLGEDNEKLAELTGFENEEIDTVLGTLADGTPGLAPKGKKGGDDEGDEGGSAVRPDAAGTCACPRCGFKWTPGGTTKIAKKAPAKAAPVDDDDGDDAPPAAKPKRKRIDLGDVPDE